MKLDQLSRILENYARAAFREKNNTRIAISITGKPGVGKSAILKQIAAKLTVEWGEPVGIKDFRAATADPVDLRGFPYLADVDGEKVTKWAQPTFFPIKGVDERRGFLLFEEFGQCVHTMQAPMAQILLDNRLGEYVMPDHWMSIAISNRDEDRAGVHKMLTLIANRFVHFEVEEDYDLWKEWALKEGNIAMEVVSFLNFRTEKLCQFDPKSGDKEFPSPRSWEFVSKSISADDIGITQEEDLFEVVKGCVGKGVAAEFAGFCKFYRNLPDPNICLEDPENADVPRSPAVLQALSGALVERCKKAKSEKLGRLMRYVTRLDPEFSVLTVRDLAMINPAVLTIKEAQPWLSKNRKFLLKDEAA